MKEEKSCCKGGVCPSCSCCICLCVKDFAKMLTPEAREMLAKELQKE